MVSRWAEMLVANDARDDPTLPAWETRTWQKIRAAVRAGRRTGRPTAQTNTDAPLPAPLVTCAPNVPTPRGDGNAEEWLGAVPASLEPGSDAQPAVQRLRLRYSKVGLARFIGTREMGTVFLRAARRAGLPVAFTAGHRPLPKISFGPALPLGCSSEDEHLDIDLTEPRAPEDVVAALAAQLPDGLIPLGADDIDRRTASIDSTMTACSYEVDVADLDDPPSDVQVGRAVHAFLHADSFDVRKIIKGRERLVDARPRVRDVTLAGPGRLRVDVRVGDGASVGPALLVGEILGLPTTERPKLRVHKLGTEFRDEAPTDGA
jgi:radical SAM-linked protein